MVTASTAQAVKMVCACGPGDPKDARSEGATTASNQTLRSQPLTRLCASQLLVRGMLVRDMSNVHAIAAPRRVGLRRPTRQRRRRLRCLSVRSRRCGAREHGGSEMLMGRSVISSAATHDINGSCGTKVPRGSCSFLRVYVASLRCACPRYRTRVRC